MILQKGSNDQNTNGEVTRFYDWAKRYAKDYAFLLGPRDGYFGLNEKSFVCEMQRRLGIVIDGKFGDRTASRVGYIWNGQSAPPVVEARRPIWFYSCPGSGADFWLGPSHDVGQMVCGKGFNEPNRKSLRINHQPVKFEKGGYLGLLGGDPKFSYIEVIASQKASILWLLQNNPDVIKAMAARRLDPKAKVDVELWFSGYSQSADGLCDAILDLFGDDGEFFLIRDRINGLICFGNPATPVTGIARKIYPAWLNKLIFNINTVDDFYAVAKDDIRPAFYAEIIKAEMELPFFVYLLQIAVPIIMKWAATFIPFLAPLLGGFGPMVQLGLGMINGLQNVSNNPLFGNLLGQAGDSDDGLAKDIEDILSPTGIWENITGLIMLVGSLGGLASHGAYHATMPPRPEFDNKTGTQFAYDHIANFTR